MKTPDAMQLAAAKLSGSDCFVTNDAVFTKVESPEIVLIDALC